MGHGGGQTAQARPGSLNETADKPPAHQAPVPAEEGQGQDVSFGLVEAVADGKGRLPAAGDGQIDDLDDRHNGRAGRDPESLGRRRGQGEGPVVQVRGQVRPGAVVQPALSGDDSPLGHDQAGSRPGQVGDDEEMGQAAGGDSAQEVIQPEIAGRVEGGHLDGPDRLQPQAHRLGHHPVHVSPAEEMIGEDAVADQHQPAQVVTFHLFDGGHEPV